jgi:pimeloyl-ACP methyl ester carboxylesterase
VGARFDILWNMNLVGKNLRAYFLAFQLLGTLKIAVATPAIPYNFTQRTDHFGVSNETFQQRYYQNKTWWGGPGHPIICIMGGEGAIPPSTGIFYPWITDVVARVLNAYVIEPEHRFYGTSLPFGPVDSFTTANMKGYFTPQQALADTAHFIQAKKDELGCDRNGEDCPVITVGGSYPGWLSAMMRLRYPAIVDIAYAASAPVYFYAQQVSQYSYYAKVTESAEKALEGCANTVRNGLKAVQALGTVDRVVEALDICTPLPAYLQGNGTTELFFQELNMVVMYTFAGLNMENYPPQGSGLQNMCKTMSATSSPVEAIKTLLHTEYVQVAAGRSSVALAGSEQLPHTASDSSSCFDFASQLPGGTRATISAGDWSGVGAGRNGEGWDFETCSYMIEQIGTNGKTDMFPARPWTLAWLAKHCASRFDGLVPQPRALVELWGFDDFAKAGATHIIFTNGLQDGWSVGGVQHNLSNTLLAFNMPNGAHHSDLSHDPVPNPYDTPDVVQVREDTVKVIEMWLKETAKQP